MVGGSQHRAPNQAPKAPSSKAPLIVGAVIGVFVLGGTISALSSDPSTESEMPPTKGVERGAEARRGAAGGSSSRSAKGDDNSRIAESVVPNVVGQNLQRAQDMMQAAGFYNLHSYDVTGESSFQILDRNWRVVEQTPRAGTAAGPGQYIDLGVVPI